MEACCFCEPSTSFCNESSMMMIYRMFSLGAIALTLFVAAAPAFAAEEAMHDGKVVSITSSKLVMSNKGDKDNKEHTHMLAADVKVTLDGKTCKAEELRAGMKIRVTTTTKDAKVATVIEAIDKSETFANTHDGKVVSTPSGG